VRADFNMEKLGYVNRAPQSCTTVSAETSEWPRYVHVVSETEFATITGSLRKTGEWSDFTIVAGGTTFPVHRVRYVERTSFNSILTLSCRLCKQSEYFKAVCAGGFAVRTLLQAYTVELTSPRRAKSRQLNFRSLR
jgi:hypothetical protein